MEVVHKGFDALDIAYPYHLPSDLLSKLAHAKEGAKRVNHDVFVTHNDVTLHVRPKGKPPNYEFSCSRGQRTENWFFKKHSEKDVWGIFVSVSAYRLAASGLHKTREYLDATLEAFGVPIIAGRESISRADFCVDVFAPEYEIERDHFVSFGKTKNDEDGDIATYNSSSTSTKTQTIRFGKNPGRVVTVYDKIAEVHANRKWHWPKLWSHRRKHLGLPELDFVNMQPASIWRVEIRAGKRHLKNDWNVTTWAQLLEKYPSICEHALDRVRLTVPSRDQNRSRWPIHPMWQLVRDEVQIGLATLPPFTQKETIMEMELEERNQQFRLSVAGSFLSWAGINQTPPDQVEMFVRRKVEEILQLYRENPERVKTKLEAARLRVS